MTALPAIALKVVCEREILGAGISPNARIGITGRALVL